MLEVHQLSRKYGSLTAVHPMSFSIQQGQIVGLLGHNGAGKTTIMKIISGYLEADTGSVSIHGIRLQSHPNEVQQLIGYLPENLPIYADLTVADYLDYVACLKGLRRHAKSQAIQSVLHVTQIENKLLQPIGTLSRGYKQRVGVAQAILGNPKLLILDEPTNGLDPQQTKHMRQLIQQLSQHATIMLSTHIMQEVDAICHRVLMLNQGHLTFNEQIEQLKQSHYLWLETSLKPEQAFVFDRINGIQQVETMHVGSMTTYRIQMQAQADQQIIAGQIAALIIAQKEALVMLKPEVRNLETLFHDLSQHTDKEVAHVA
ncbi:MAG: ABC transporter ATP-binding protein [Shewanellaceae bacterium]|nr:ABC transporter ATP-binding protein [Shewanellaceae bacterium]